MAKFLLIPVPDWYNEETDLGQLALFRARELLSCRNPDGSWQVKEGRCSRCGTCCIGCGIYPRIEESKGVFRCGNDSFKPFVCCLTPLTEGVNTETDKVCTISFKVVPWDHIT